MNDTPHVGVQIGSREAVRSVKEWISDGLMTLFFFLVALELKREVVLGELGHPRVAALSIAAAVGGMLVPAVGPERRAASAVPMEVLREKWPCFGVAGAAATLVARRSTHAPAWGEAARRTAAGTAGR